MPPTEQCNVLHRYQVMIVCRPGKVLAIAPASLRLYSKGYGPKTQLSASLWRGQGSSIRFSGLLKRHSLPKIWPDTGLQFSAKIRRTYAGIDSISFLLHSGG